MTEGKTIIITSSYQKAANVCEVDLGINIRDRRNVWVFSDRSKISAWVPYPGDRIVFIDADPELREYAEYRMARRPDRSQYTVEYH